MLNDQLSDIETAQEDCCGRAGSYSIEILDSKSQDRLPGGPVALVVAPAAPVAWQSAAEFGKSLNKEGIIAAGNPLEVTLAVKDVHGNDWPGAAIMQIHFCRHWVCTQSMGTRTYILSTGWLRVSQLNVSLLAELQLVLHGSINFPSPSKSTEREMQWAVPHAMCLMRPLWAPQERRCWRSVPVALRRYLLKRLDPGSMLHLSGLPAHTSCTPRWRALLLLVRPSETPAEEHRFSLGIKCCLQPFVGLI